MGRVGQGVGMAKQEAAQSIILPGQQGGCALCSPYSRALGSLGSCLCWFFLSVNEHLLLQAQRLQKVQQTQLCDPVPAVPLPSQDGYIHLSPLGQRCCLAETVREP